MNNNTKLQEEPLVSVVMATYNEQPEIISKAVESILCQTYSHLELLIYDDSTSVKTKEAIDKFRIDERVKLIRGKERKGFVASLNNGLETAKGEYIARMDGDDISLPNRFEKEIKYLETHPDIMVVGGQIDMIDDRGRVRAKRNYPQGGLRLFLFSCIRNPLAHPTVMIRRKIIEKGYRYDNELEMSEDLDLWLRLLNDGYKIANIPDTVLYYRIMDNFIEKRGSDRQRKTMAYVRKKNYSGKHLMHSTLSAIFGWMFEHAPKKVINQAYRYENRG